ncbi:unnamed protein product, partial [Brachionus calyciflorus]
MDFKEISLLEPLELINFLMSIGLLYRTCICTKCKIECKLRKRQTPEKYSWRCTKCSTFYSVKSGSFFEQFKLSIINVLEIVDYWAKDRKQADMHESLKISRPSIFKICHLLRQLCFLDLDKENFKVGGKNSIVEIDESVFNKVKYNKGKDMIHMTKNKQIWVFGIRERISKKVFFQAVNNRKENTLIPIIQKHILPDSIIYSDMWKSYDSIAYLPQNYKHFSVNHSKEFVDKRTGCNTNSIESVWLKCKSKIRQMQGVNRLYLQENLDEVMWRHNECGIVHKCQYKYSRRLVFNKILNLMQINNMKRLEERMEEVENEHKLHNRIKNIEKLFENDFKDLVSRSTQTEASSFDYKVKRKKENLEFE